MAAEWQAIILSVVRWIMKETVLVCLVLTIAWLISLSSVAAFRSEQAVYKANREAEAVRVAAMLAE